MTMTREDTANRLEAGARYVSVTDTALSGVMMAAVAMLREDGEHRQETQRYILHETKIKAEFSGLLADALAGLEPFTRLLVYISEHVPNDNKIVLAEVWNSRTICTVGDLRIARNLCARLETALRGSTELAGERT